MTLPRETQIFRQDARSKGSLLTPAQREDLIKPYLPRPVRTSKDAAPQKRISRPVRTFLRTQLHILVFTVIHTFFSIYIRLRQTYHVLRDRIFAILYYHHRAPELIQQDVKNLSRLPQHLSVILELKGGSRDMAGLETLMDEVAELSAWCACVGIPMLSVYEKTGMTHSLDPANPLDLWFADYQKVLSKHTSQPLIEQFPRNFTHILESRYHRCKFELPTCHPY